MEKPDVDALLGVEAPVEVSGVAVRRGDHDSSSVSSLPDASSVGPPSHFFDQDWGQPLGSQLLVHAEEVYLNHFNLLSIDRDVDRNR